MGRQDKNLIVPDKVPFEEPRIIATYEKEELEEAIRPHLNAGTYGVFNGGGCG